MDVESQICMNKVDSWEGVFTFFGDNKGIAEIFEISEAAVSQWKRHGIPKGRLQYLKLMKPDLDWPSIENSLADRFRGANNG
jgi:hypothetical protein